MYEYQSTNKKIGKTIDIHMRKWNCCLPTERKVSFYCYAYPRHYAFVIEQGYMLITFETNHMVPDYNKVQN